MTDLEQLVTDDEALGRNAALAILAADVVVAAALYALRHRDAAARA